MALLAAPNLGSDRGLRLRSGCWCLAASLFAALAATSCERETLVAVTDSSTGGFAASDAQTEAQGGSTSSCLNDNESCSSGTDCCSGTCSEGVSQVCLPIRPCLGGGESCESPADCCSWVCSNGTCPTHPGCALVGESCFSNTDCCSGACTNGGDGTLTCQALDGCRPDGEICSSAECCSGLGDCIFDSTLGNNRCAPAPGCRPTGELCNTSQSDAPCCNSMSGVNSPDAGCGETSVGVLRCMANPPSPCLQDGSPCQIQEDCCSRHCLPNPNGLVIAGSTFHCAHSCAHVGASCGASDDCCDNMICVNNVCQRSGKACKQLGVSCAAPAECCSSLCNTATKTCQVSP